MCQPREHLARIFSPAHCTCVNFFWDDGLVHEFFSYAYVLAGYFFPKSPTPAPQSKMVGPLRTEKYLSRSFETLRCLLRRCLPIEEDCFLCSTTHWCKEWCKNESIFLVRRLTQSSNRFLLVTKSSKS